METRAGLKKAELRKIIKNRLTALSPEQFSASGFAAAQQLSHIPRWNDFRSVLAFVSLKDEINTLPVMETSLKAGKSLFVPRIEGKLLAFYREPEGYPAIVLKPEDFPALVITPGIAFDHSLKRLGRGRGYYDRFFAALDSMNRNYSALGLCMDCQLVDEVPVEPWDKDMNFLLTANGILPAH